MIASDIAAAGGPPDTPFPLLVDLAQKLAGKDAKEIEQALASLRCRDCPFPMFQGGDNVFPLDLKLVSTI